MKIAGRKNDGAWFRTNKVLAHLNQDTIAALIFAWKANAELYPQSQAAFAEIQSMAATSGVATAAGITTADAWIEAMCQHGIPRQVWFGRYTFMTYSKVVENGVTKYVPDFGTQLFSHAKLLRRFFKNYVFAIRGFNDQTNQGVADGLNPGKLPDDNVLS